MKAPTCASPQHACQGGVRFLDIFAKIENNKQLKNVDLRYHNGLAVEWIETQVMQQKKLKLKS